MGNPDELPPYSGTGPSQASEKQPYSPCTEKQGLPQGNVQFDSRTQLACMTFSSYDAMRFMSFPEDVITTLHAILSEAWPKGLAKTKDYSTSREFTFHGMPWDGDSEGNPKTRKMVLDVISTLYDHGWVLHVAAGFSQKRTSRDAIFFRHVSPPPPPCDWLTVAACRSDHLRIAPIPHPELTAALIEAFGDQVRDKSVTEQHLYLKFHENLWNPTSKTTVLMPMLIMAMLEAFEKFGYTVYGNFNDLIVSENHGQTDLLILQRQKSWSRGLPVFHR